MVVIDDGTPTQLIRKGDGVQSLAALSLMRHASERSGAGRNLILAIDQPESNLNQTQLTNSSPCLRRKKIARKHQVIMTTHCPLFVDRASIKSNILVHKNKAAPARDVRQIREILECQGIRQLAARRVNTRCGRRGGQAGSSCVAEPALKATRCHHGSTSTWNRISSGWNKSELQAEPNQGSDVLGAHFQDHDDCGLKSAQRAEREGLLLLADVTFTTCNGMKR